MAIAQVVPIYETAKVNLELPACTLSGFTYLLEQYRTLFYTKPGYTEDTWHYIPTTGNPVKVPPRRIPAQYRTEVTQQLQTMLDEGIIKLLSVGIVLGWHQLFLFLKTEYA